MKQENETEKETTAETLASDEALGPSIEGPSNTGSHLLAERFMGLMLKIPEDNVLLGALSNAYMNGRKYRHTVDEVWTDSFTYGNGRTWCYGALFEDIHKMNSRGVIDNASEGVETHLTRLEDWLTDSFGTFYSVYRDDQEAIMRCDVPELDHSVNLIFENITVGSFDGEDMFNDILDVIQSMTGILIGWTPDANAGDKTITQFVEGIEVSKRSIRVAYGDNKEFLGPIHLDYDIVDCIDDMTFEGSSLIPLEIRAYLKYYAELPIPMAPLVKIMHSGAYEWMAKRIGGSRKYPLSTAMAMLFESERDEEFFSYNASKAYDMLALPQRSDSDIRLSTHDDQDGVTFTELYGDLIASEGFRPQSDSVKDINAAIWDMVSEADFAHRYRSFVRSMINMYVKSFGYANDNLDQFLLSPHHTDNSGNLFDPGIASYLKRRWANGEISNPKEFYVNYLETLGVNCEDSEIFSVPTTLDTLFMLPRVCWDPLGLIDSREIVTLQWSLSVNTDELRDAALCLLQSYQYYHYFRHENWSLLERLIRREGHLHCSFLWNQKRVKIDYTFDRAIAVARILNVKDVHLILNKKPIPLNKTIEGSEWSNLFDGSSTHPLVHDDTAKAVFEGDEYRIVKSFIPVRAILCTTLTKTNDHGRKEKYSVPVCLQDVLATTIPRHSDELMKIVHSYNSLRAVDQQMIRASSRSIGDMARASMLVGRGAESLMSNTMLSLNNTLLERKALASFKNNFWPVLTISDTYVRIYANIYRHFANAWDDRSILDNEVFDHLDGYSVLLNQIRSLPDVMSKLNYLSLVRTIMYDWACRTDIGVYITGRLPKNAVNTYALVKEVI